MNRAAINMNNQVHLCSNGEFFGHMTYGLIAGSYRISIFSLLETSAFTSIVGIPVYHPPKNEKYYPFSNSSPKFIVIYILLFIYYFIYYRALYFL